MKKSENASPIFALCGPSGVGKGHTKRAIQNAAEGSFVEPIVATTRPVRSGGDASRISGLTENSFFNLVDSGRIILPHRPFRRDTSPLYGFLADSIVPDQPVLTEIHSTLVGDIHRHFPSRPIEVYGMVALRQTLERNIAEREGDTYMFSEDVALRLELAAMEEEEIRLAASEKLVKEVFCFDHEVRDASRGKIVDLALASLVRHGNE